MNGWQVFVWGMAPLVVGALLVYDWQSRRRGNSERASSPPRVLLGRRVAPDSGLDRLTPRQLMAMQAPPRWPAHSEPAYLADTSRAIAPLLIELAVLPIRLAWWAWLARTWRPLAFIFAYLLAMASPLAGLLRLLEVGGVPEAVDLAYAALLQVPALLVVGLWPWKRRGSVGYAVAAGTVLAGWIVLLRAIGA